METIRIDTAKGFIEVELCREHAAPVWDLIRSLPDHLFVQVAGDHPRSRSTSFRVHTMEEIERMRRPKK